MGTTIAYRVILEPEAGSSMTFGTRAKMPSGIPTTCFLRVGAPMAFLARRTREDPIQAPMRAAHQDWMRHGSGGLLPTPTPGSTPQRLLPSPAHLAGCLTEYLFSLITTA